MFDLALGLKYNVAMTETKKCVEWVEGPYVRNLVWFRDRLNEMISHIPDEHLDEATVRLEHDHGYDEARFYVHYHAADYPGAIIDTKQT